MTVADAWRWEEGEDKDEEQEQELVKTIQLLGLLLLAVPKRKEKWRLEIPFLENMSCDLIVLTIS